MQRGVIEIVFECPDVFLPSRHNWVHCRDHLSRVAKLKEEALKRKSENKVKQEGAPSAALEKKQPAPADDGESDDNDEDLELGSSLLLDWRARGSA